MSAGAFGFRLLETDGRARTGEIATAHGVIRTPAFMPVGTQASVKGLFPEQIQATGADVILANTYHLLLRPGPEALRQFGGVGGFMGWSGPVLTDSGGFQVMSLAGLRRIDEQGVRFRSHIDGGLHDLTPERAMAVQDAAGADIHMQLDQCLAFPHTYEEAKRAMALSLRWAARSRAAFVARPGRGCFGIVQGGDDEALRRQSALALMDIGFHGYALGGLAVGEGQEVMLKVIDQVEPLLPCDQPRYLMGVGTPGDIIAAVARGMDMFDCVLPTRSGRHGQAFTRFGKLNLRNARFAGDQRPLDETSRLPAAREMSRGYLHHLFKCREILGQVILSWSNIAYYQELMAAARQAIAQKRFTAWREEVERGWREGDGDANR